MNESPKKYVEDESSYRPVVLLLRSGNLPEEFQYVGLAVCVEFRCPTASCHSTAGRFSQARIVLT